MLSYQSLFFKICERIGLNHKGMKEYATRLKEAPTMEDKSSFMATALEMLNDDYSDVHDDKHKVATYLWKFVSDYSGGREIKLWTEMTFISLRFLIK